MAQTVAQMALAPAPGNGGPDALVEIVPGDFGRDLEPGNRARDLYPAGEKPADRERVERSQCAPADRLEDRSDVRLCSAERNHRVRLHKLRMTKSSTLAPSARQRALPNSPMDRVPDYVHFAKRAGGLKA